MIAFVVAEGLVLIHRDMQLDSLWQPVLSAMPKLWWHAWSGNPNARLSQAVAAMKKHKVMSAASIAQLQACFWPKV